MTERLRLKTVDGEDLPVIAACLQDALVMVGDIAYEAAAQRFVLVANRFRWEAAERGESGAERTTAALTVEHVTAVRRRGIEPARREAILSLLSIRPAEGGLELVFSGGGAIRLETPEIAMRLMDMGEPWPTLWRPRHE